MIQNPLNTCLLADYHGKIIGTTVAINYSNDMAWISMVLVDKVYRGQGISKLLLKQVLESTHSWKSVKLDATAEGQNVYKQFNFIDELSITRLTREPMIYTDVGDDHLMTPVRTEDLAEIIGYDQLVFGVNRSRLITWLHQEFSKNAWVLKRNDGIAGIVMGREGRNYNHIGPVMASGFNDAAMLIKKLINQFNHKPIVADVLNDKEEVIKWLNDIGFSKQRTFVRMHQNDNPWPGNPKQQYLICGPEFG